MRARTREMIEFRRTEFRCRGSTLERVTERRPSVENLTDTLMEQVDKRPHSKPLEWGDPLLSTTPTSIAIRELAARTQALTDAVRDIALVLEKLQSELDGLRATERLSQSGEHR